MRMIEDGARGLNLLVRLNADRLLVCGTLALALLGGAWLAGG